VDIKIYTDIDTVFDTRLSAMLNYSKILASFELDNGYTTNERAGTIMLKPRVLDRLVAKNRRLRPIPTDIFKPIMKLIHLLIGQSDAEGAHLVIHMTFNVYGYDISKEEKDTLATLFKGVILSPMELTIVDRAPDVPLIGDQDYVIMYNGMDWINKVLIPSGYSIANTMMTVPRMSYSKEEFTDNVEKLVVEQLSTFIGLDMIPVEYFRALKPKEGR